MTAAWAMWAAAQAGPWLLLPLGLATGWVAYRLAHRARRRANARRAERRALYAALITEARRRDNATTQADEIAALEQLYRHPAATRRNTRKENQ